MDDDGETTKIENQQANNNNEATVVNKEENSLIKIKVLLFARARDLCGLPELFLEMASGSTAHDCLNNLLTKYPGLEDIRGCMVLALNEEYTPEDTVVKDRDELALIPPISGG